MNLSIIHWKPYFNDADYFLGNDLHCLKQTDLTVPPAMHFPVGDPVRWAGPAKKQGRRWIVQGSVFPCELRRIVGVAIKAALAAGMVGTNIDAGCAGTFGTLARIFRHVDFLAKQLGNEMRVDAAGWPDAEWLQVQRL